MGVILSNLTSLLTKKTPRRVLMVGLDGAGKSTILYGFQNKKEGNLVETIIPTVGFNVENIKIGTVTLNVWDIGGQQKIRTLWGFYADGLSGLIYVIDIDDSSRWEAAVEELRKLIEKDKFEGTSAKKYPVLVFANKKDKLEPSSIEGVRMKLNEALNPTRLFEGREWRVQVCSALDRAMEDIYNGMEWISKELTDPGSEVF